MDKATFERCWLRDDPALPEPSKTRTTYHEQFIHSILTEGQADQLSSTFTLTELQKWHTQQSLLLTDPLLGQSKIFIPNDTETTYGSILVQLYCNNFEITLNKFWTDSREERASMAAIIKPSDAEQMSYKIYKDKMKPTQQMDQLTFYVMHRLGILPHSVAKTLGIDHLSKTATLQQIETIKSLHLLHHAPLEQDRHRRDFRYYRDHYTKIRYNLTALDEREMDYSAYMTMVESNKLPHGVDATTTITNYATRRTKLGWKTKVSPFLAYFMNQMDYMSAPTFAAALILRTYDERQSIHTYYSDLQKTIRRVATQPLPAPSPHFGAHLRSRRCPRCLRPNFCYSSS